MFYQIILDSKHPPPKKNKLADIFNNGVMMRELGYQTIFSECDFTYTTTGACATTKLNLYNYF